MAAGPVRFVSSVSLHPEEPREQVQPSLLGGRTVTAFLGRTARGPLNQAVEVRDFDAFLRCFGGCRAFTSLPQNIECYFQQGGTTAMVVRLANRAAAATVEIPTHDRPLRLRALAPGTDVGLRVSVDHDGVAAEPGRFNLVVQRIGVSTGRRIEDQELYSSISVAEDETRFIGTALEGSRLVALAGSLPESRPLATAPARPGAPIPYFDFSNDGSDGEKLTDYDIVGSSRDGSGLFALDAIPRVDLLCIPSAPDCDFGTTARVAASRYCSRRRAMLIWDPPSAWNSVEEALAAVSLEVPGSPDTLAYFPRIVQRIDEMPPRGLSAAGAIAGMLAAGDAACAARNEARMKLSGRLTPEFAISRQQAIMLHRAGINTLTRASGREVHIEGDVCLAADRSEMASWCSLSRRRTLLLALAAVERELEALAADSTGRFGIQNLEVRVRRVLGELHEQGRLAGTIPEQSWFVHVMPGDDCGQPNRLRFGIALAYPGRFTVYEVHCSPEAATLHKLS